MKPGHAPKERQPPEEVAPGIFRLALPLPDSPLGTVNAYAVILDDGLRLIDCGWDTPMAYEALSSGLANLGLGVRDLREIVVTHIHPDHFGLAARLASESGASLAMHRLDAAYVGARYEDTQALVQKMEAWMRLNGVPSGELAGMAEGSLQMLRHVGNRLPDTLLDGGEELTWGQYTFRVIWTPGHSAGLICIHDAQSGVFFSDDHVLRRISPHVGLHVQSSGNPLRDYLHSLRLVRDLPVRVVLPGHGSPFSDLASRVDELILHHEKRLETILALLADGQQSAHAISSRLSWRGSAAGWQNLAPFQRRMALTETLAHLEYLYVEGRVERRSSGIITLYHLPDSAGT